MCSWVISFALTSLLPSLFGAGLVQADSSNMRSRLAHLESEVNRSSALPSAERIRIVSGAFLVTPEEINTPGMKKFSDEEIEILFRATNILTFYASSAEHLNLMEHSFHELERRGLDRMRDRFDMHGAYIAERRFDEARAFSEKRKFNPPEEPSEINLSADVESEGISVLVASQQERNLTLEKISISEKSIIVVAHPMCHFSYNAMMAIDSDPDLASIFSQHAVWIAPVSRNIYFDALQQWNNSHAAINIKIAYNAREWPWISSWETPNFYFLHKGEVVDQVTGWPQEGNRESIIRAIKKLWPS